jgi:hypothetical protein
MKCGGKVPNAKSRIHFIAKNLTEEEALKFEMILIGKLGRKDIGTGILRNLTDGGESIKGLSKDTIQRRVKKRLESGWKHSEETKNRLSLLKLGKPSPKKGIPTGKVSPSCFKRGRIPHNKGKPRSKETKQKQSIAMKGRQWTESRKQKVRETWQRKLGNM